MNRKFRIAFLACITVIAVVIGILIVRPFRVYPYPDPLVPEAIQTAVEGTVIASTNDYSQPPPAYATQTEAYIVGLVLTARGLAISPTPTQQGASSSALLTPTASGTCAFRRAYQNLTDAAQAAQDAFDNAGVKSITVIRAEALGEDCESADGKVVSYAGMSSDFYLLATVSSLDDTMEVAKVVKAAYSTITKLDLPLYATLGYLDITILAGSKTGRFRAMFSQIKAALKAEKGDASLLAVGGL